MRKFAIGIAIGLIAFSGQAAEAPDLTGKALAIDGDTLKVTDAAGEAVTIRLWGIDAPEMTVWPWGPMARAALDHWIGDARGQVRCTFKPGRTHGRRVGVCGAGETSDLGRALIGAGLAVEWRSYSEGAYASDECWALNRQLGLWGASAGFGVAMSAKPWGQWSSCNGPRPAGGDERTGPYTPKEREQLERLIQRSK